MNKELALKLLAPYLPDGRDLSKWRHKEWVLAGTHNNIAIGWRLDWERPVYIYDRPTRPLLDAVYWYMAYIKGPTFFDTANERTSRF